MCIESITEIDAEAARDRDEQRREEIADLQAPSASASVLHRREQEPRAPSARSPRAATARTAAAASSAFALELHLGEALFT
jgi:hypothetical protein